MIYFLFLVSNFYVSGLPSRARIKAVKVFNDLKASGHNTPIETQKQKKCPPKRTPIFIYYDSSRKFICVKLPSSPPSQYFRHQDRTSSSVRQEYHFRQTNHEQRLPP